MPHLFTNRPRLHGLGSDRENLKRHFLWETINAAVYKIGGLVFIVGSILFFPALNAYADIGAWTFFGRSLLYLLVTVHDLVEVHRHWRTERTHGLQRRLEYVAAASYTLGTVLFTAGSVFFLSAVGWVIPGAWCFVTGSALFVLGACVSAPSEAWCFLQGVSPCRVRVSHPPVSSVAPVAESWEVRGEQNRRSVHRESCRP